MLVLTRKAGEQVVIAGNIRITVVDIGQGRVRLGIEAPREVRVDRAEIHAAKLEDAPAPVVVDNSALHNRIADKLPAEPPAPPLENRIKGVRPFPPRKPR